MLSPPGKKEVTLYDMLKNDVSLFGDVIAVHIQIRDRRVREYRHECRYSFWADLVVCAQLFR